MTHDFVCTKKKNILNPKDIANFKRAILTVKPKLIFTSE